MTSHIHPCSLGSTAHDVGGGLSRRRSTCHGHLDHPARPQVVQVPAGVGSSNNPNETAKVTQRLIRCLPTEVRVTSTGAAAVVQPQDRDNNELQRLQNRYPSDVPHLMSIFKDAVACMDAAGERSPGSGEINGWKSNWNTGAGFHPRFLKCADQAAEVMGALVIRAQTRAKWTYTFEQRIPGPVPLLVWVKAQSDNPNDPVLHLDAWNNEVRIEPAAAKTTDTKN